MIALYTNNAKSTVAAPIGPANTTVTVAPGDGAKFPQPVPGVSFFMVSFFDAATKLITEICQCTARVGDTLTIVRGQEGTPAASWIAGDIVSHNQTAGSMSNLAQIQQAQQGLYNYAQDTGTANAVRVNLSPAVTGHVPGLYIRIKAAATNTGATTLDCGAGPAPVINPDGSALGANALVLNGIFEVVDDGVNYQLISYSQQLQSSAGVMTTGDFKWRPTSESIAGFIIANATTIGNAASGATQRANADTANLFAWHWNFFSNTICPVSDSAGNPVARGANAAADFAANRRIQVFDMRCMIQAGVDTMGSGVPSNRFNGVPITRGAYTTPGSLIGESLHTLIVNELPSHTHANVLNDPTHVHGNTLSDPSHVHGNTLSDPSHSHQMSVPSRLYGNYQTYTSGQAIVGIQVQNGSDGNVFAANAFTGAFVSNAAALTGMSINNAANSTGMTITNAAIGGSASHNNVQLSVVGYFYIKL